MERELLEKRLRALMDSWTFPGAAHEPLIPVMEEAVCGWFGPGKALCQEGEAGDRMFFLFDGSVEVRKKNRFGKSERLVTIHAPAVMGHMSLLDRSRRSATCVVARRAYVGIISEKVFQRYSDDRGPAGTVFRRLILASLSRQLKNGDARLHELLSGTTEVDEEQARGELRSTVGELEGWSTRSVPEDGDWKSLVERRARNLPMEKGAELRVSMTAPVPLTLTMRGLSPGASERVVQRFIRFLHTIPTPPQVELVYVSCTSSLLQRPQQVSKQLSFYFARSAYQVDGNEEKITVVFPSADSRW